MKFLNILKFVLIALPLFSCALIDKRDFEDEMDEYRMDDPVFMAGEDFEITSGDTGNSFRNYDTIINRTPPTQRMRERTEHNRSIAGELEGLEINLSQREYAYYQSVKHTLASDSEKIYFINLSADEKLSYLELKGLKPKRAASRNIASVSNQGIRMGMTMREVVSMLGYPERKEVAGDPSQMNERWIYSVNDEPQYVYFANAKVEGWE